MPGGVFGAGIKFVEIERKLVCPRCWEKVVKKKSCSKKLEKVKKS
jgi:hypothetical protein